MGKYILKIIITQNIYKIVNLIVTLIVTLILLFN